MSAEQPINLEDYVDYSSASEYAHLTQENLGVLSIDPVPFGVVMVIEKGMPQEFRAILRGSMPVQVNIIEGVKREGRIEVFPEAADPGEHEPYYRRLFEN